MIYSGEVLKMELNVLRDLLDTAYEYGCRLVDKWHDNKIQQIRLSSANRRHVEDYRFELFQKRDALRRNNLNE